MDLKSKIILISGPTASGKSSFSIKLAKKINGEIINADSMQVYKELKILTARPKNSECKNIKHHLYGIHSVKKKFSSGQWLNLAIQKIEEIKKKNKTPILVGGTGLYFQVLTDGLVKIPNIPFSYRDKIRFVQKKIGQEKFFNKLIKLDPLAFNKINISDVHRSLRAYEVKSYTKKSIYTWFKNTQPKFYQTDFFKIYIDFPKKDLVNRISKRTERMFDIGVISEVKQFLKLRVSEKNSSKKIIGINEITDFLKKKYDLKETKERITIKTRQYAKRQRTWARGKMINWRKLNPKDFDQFLKKI